MQLLLPLLAAAIVRAAPDYFPNNEGNVWKFVAPDSTPVLSWRITGWGLFGDSLILAQKVALEQPGYADTLGLIKTRDGVYFCSPLGQPDQGRSRQLRLPLKPGARWIAHAGPDTTWAELAGFEDVTVPAGTYRECARIRYHGLGRSFFTWYAPNVGPVMLGLDTTVGDPSAFAGQPPRLMLATLALTRVRPVPPRGRARAALLQAGRHEALLRRVDEAMFVFQTALEAWAADHHGNYPGPEVSWEADDSAGFGRYLPGGDSIESVSGRFPLNPFTGEPYRIGHDLFYQPGALAAAGLNARKLSADPLCPFRELAAPGGIPGTILILGHTAGDGTGLVREYAIVGYGRELDEPNWREVPGRTDDRLFLVLHN